MFVVEQQPCTDGTSVVLVVNHAFSLGGDGPLGHMLMLAGLALMTSRPHVLPGCGSKSGRQ